MALYNPANNGTQAYRDEHSEPRDPDFVEEASTLVGMGLAEFARGWPAHVVIDGCPLLRRERQMMGDELVGYWYQSAGVPDFWAMILND